MGGIAGRFARVLERSRYTAVFCCHHRCALDKPTVILRAPSSPVEMDAVRDIFREYADTLGVDLCFQDFERELASLPGDYAEPRGALLLAEVEGAIAGCCALRPLDTADYPNASEMKRLFVRKAFRGFGLGRHRLQPPTCRRRAIPAVPELLCHRLRGWQRAQPHQGPNQGPGLVHLHVERNAGGFQGQSGQVR